jgi:2-dehydropantoate 2-reductase
MNILVYGAGAVGRYFGGRMIQGGHQVIFVVRPGREQLLREQGIKVTSTSGDFTINEVCVTSKPSRQQHLIDLILLCTKCYSLPEIAPSISRLLDSSTLVLPLQNGVGISRFLSSFIPKHQLLTGLCFVLAELRETGMLIQRGPTPRIVFGSEFGAETDRLQALKDILSLCPGMEANFADDIITEAWSKFFSVAAIGAVGAVSRMPLGITRSYPGTRNMIISCMREIIKVGKTQGADLQEELAKTTMRLRDEFPPSVTTSMQRDIMSGAPSKLDWQLGEVVRIATEHNLSVPTSSFLYDALRPMDMLARGELTLPSDKKATAKTPG